MKPEAQQPICPPPVLTAKVLPVDTEKLLAEVKRKDGEILAWLDKQKGGRACLGEVLQRIQGCTPKARMQFCQQGGLNLKLVEQETLLENILTKACSVETRRNLVMQSGSSKLSRAQIKKLSARIGSSVAAVKAQYEVNQPHLFSEVVNAAVRDRSPSIRKRVLADSLAGLNLGPGTINIRQRDSMCGLAARFLSPA